MTRERLIHLFWFQLKVGCLGNDSFCKRGYKCINNKCIKPKPCRMASDCPPNHYCNPDIKKCLKHSWNTLSWHVSVEFVYILQLFVYRLTFMITHGYLEHGKKNWLIRLKEKLLQHGDYNVIILDWLPGSGPPYTQVSWAQCENFRIFLSLSFYVKSILENIKVYFT